MGILNKDVRNVLFLIRHLTRISDGFFRALYKKIKMSVIFLLVFTLACYQAFAQTGDKSYIVQAGDSIWKICKQQSDYPNCWQELAKYNQLDEKSPIIEHQQLKIPSQWLSNPVIFAHAIHVSGEARYLAKNKSIIPLAEGQQLMMGDSVLVGEGSVTIQFADGAVLVMEDSTEIVIDSMSVFQLENAYSFDIRLPVGGVKVSVPKRTPKTQFKVRTPAGVAAVRGTEFRVFSGNEVLTDKNILIKSEVLEGEVAVESKGLKQNVSAGFAVSATESSPLSPTMQLIEAPKWNFSCNDPGYVEWQKSSQAKWFNLVLMEDDDQIDKVLKTVVLEGSNYTFKNLDEGCYQLRVNAVDEKSYRGLEAQRQLCYSRHLTQPLLNSASLTRERILLAWSPVEYATTYVVEISRDESFNEIIASKVFDETDIEWSLEKNIPSGFIRVKAKGENLDDSIYSRASYIEQINHRHRWMGLLSSLFAILII